MAIKYKLVDPSKDKPDEAYPWNIAGFTHEGEKLSNSLIESVRQVFAQIQEKANHVYERIHKGELIEDAPLGEFVDAEVKKYLLTQSEAERPLLKAIFNQWIVRETDITGCNSLNDLSLNYYGLYQHIPGGNLVIPKPGYGQVVQCLIDDATQTAKGQFELLLKHEVTKIKWNGGEATSKGPIEVTCANGAVFQCSHLVNTMPVGVLKAKVQTLYEPSLPQPKVDSINRLNFDFMNKFFLEFEKPLFPDYIDPSINEIMSFFKLPEELEKEVKSQTNLEKHWVKKICSFVRLNDRLLLAFISGEEAKYAEKLDQAVLIREITGLLRSMLRNPAFPEPSRIVQTTWGNDPFTRGCYTNVRIGASLKDIQQLEQPVFVPGSDKVSHFSVLIDKMILESFDFISKLI